MDKWHVCVCAKLLQSCLTLCNPMDYSPSGSSVHGILQARMLEWVAMPFSRGIFPMQGLNSCLLHLFHWQVGSLPLAPPGKPGQVIYLGLTPKTSFAGIVKVNYYPTQLLRTALLTLFICELKFHECLTFEGPTSGFCNKSVSHSAVGDTAQL